MSFLFFHTVTDNDFGEVCVFSGFFNGTDKITTKDIFCEVQAKGMIPLSMQPSVAIKSAHSRSPIIGYKKGDPALDPSQGATDLTAVYGFILQATGGKMAAFQDRELLKTIKAQLVTAFGDPNSAKLVLELMVAQVLWELNDYTGLSNVDKEYTCSMELQNLLTTSDLTKGVPNETLRQETCTDKLFIELPSYYELISEDESAVFNKLPVKDQICTLYTDARMYTLQYESACRDNKQKLLEVIGDSKNNTLEIFDNEKEFYDAVINWVNTNMQNADTKVIDADTQHYLYLLIYQMYILNWGHNKRVPLRMLPETSSRNEDNLDSDGASRFIMRGECTPGDNACMSLREFITDNVAAYGHEILVKILIQLCRWGDRKPSCLVVGTDKDDLSDKVFDLNEGEIRIQRQVKGELVEKDPDKFLCIGTIYSKPDFAVGYVRKVVSTDDTGAEFVTMYPVFFGDYLNDFEKQGKEFVMETDNTVLLSTVLGPEFTGYVNEETRKYVCTLGTENITLSREFNSIYALNTVLANGAEKLSLYRVDSASDIFTLASRVMVEIAHVACYNYFREYAPVFAELNTPVTYESWKTLIEKYQAVLGSFRPAPKAADIVQPVVKEQEPVAAPAQTQTSSVFGAAPVQQAVATPPVGVTQPVVTEVKQTPGYVKASETYLGIFNIKYGDTVVGQVGTSPIQIGEKKFVCFTILDPSQPRQIPDTPENSKSLFLIMAHVVHAFRAMAVNPAHQRVFFETENAHKAFATSVSKLL